MRHLSLECRFEAWFQNANRFQNANKAFISWMPLWSVICRQKANTKAKGKCKIGKWFLCPKCGIYLLNAALKRDFVDFRRQIQRQNAKAKANAKEKGFYALNAAFISWMPLWSVIFRFQNANTKAKCKWKGKCIGKWFICPKCGIYLLNAALKRDFSISECKYKGKMQMQRQMHRKMVFMP